MQAAKFSYVQKRASQPGREFSGETPGIYRPYDRDLQIEVMRLKTELVAKTVILEKFDKVLQEVSSLVKKSSLPVSEKKQYNILFRNILSTNPEALDDTLFTLHQDTINGLTTMYPNLTANNIKLCILILKGLTTKEISDYLFVHPRSVKVARSRLRKKLSLCDDTSLFSFLQNL